jgi:hypothetical protein
MASRSVGIFLIRAPFSGLIVYRTGFRVLAGALIVASTATTRALARTAGAKIVVSAGLTLALGAFFGGRLIFFGHGLRRCRLFDRLGLLTPAATTPGTAPGRGRGGRLLDDRFGLGRRCIAHLQQAGDDLVLFQFLVAAQATFTSYFKQLDA